MKKGTTTLLIILLIVVLLGSVFLLVDFRAAQSNLAQNSTVASSSGGNEAALSRSPDKTGLFVSSEGKLGAALQQALTQKMNGWVVTGQVVPVDGTSDKADYPLLFITIEQQDISWTPVYARADLKIAMFYSSDGDVSFRHSQPPEFKQTSNQPTLKMDGTYSFTDVSYGLISSPGYVNYLAGEIAKAIATNIQNGK